MSSQLTLSSMLLRVSPSPSLGSPELPVLQRSPRSSQSQSRSQSRSQSHGQPTLPKTIAYIFTHGLFKRTLLLTDPPSVQYACIQLSCNYSTKILGIRLTSTGNLIKHYNNHHKDVLTSAIKEQQMKKLDQPKRPDFFRKYSSGTGDHIRKLILYVIVSNNLLLSLVESPSFRALIKALNLAVLPISRQTLIQDLTLLFSSGQELLILRLAKHIKGGGRLPLTTDT